MAGAKNKRLREMILFVLKHQHMDRVKLGNILWLADLEAYHKHGEPISGVDYVKRPWGAEPRNFGHILGAMKRNGMIEAER